MYFLYVICVGFDLNMLGHLKENREKVVEEDKEKLSVFSWEEENGFDVDVHGACAEFLCRFILSEAKRASTTTTTTITANCVLAPPAGD